MFGPTSRLREVRRELAGGLGDADVAAAVLVCAVSVHARVAGGSPVARERASAFVC
jgi:hypothetical protein